MNANLRTYVKPWSNIHYEAVTYFEIWYLKSIELVLKMCQTQKSQ